MGRETFLIVLAALTVLCGVALLIMARKRRAERARSEESPRRSMESIADEESADERATPPRRIDEYAIPVSFERARDLLDDEVDVGKICPRCGARYGSHHRFCERDNSELAALN